MNHAASAIEFKDSFYLIGTIEKMETFNSKGGGLKLVIQTSETDKAVDILNAKGNVCQFHVSVSEHKSVEPTDEEGELDFDDIDPQV